jgi:uncharacterized membrane protein YedE/YeeE
VQEVKTEQRWRPYLAGALAGLLAIGSAYATTKILKKTSYLGCSTTYVRAAGLIEQSVVPERVEKNAYFQKEKVKVDWQFMLVCGIFLGALAAALTGSAFEWEDIPPLWAKRFGRSVLLRGACAFAGGAVAMFGARLADGCPSGHGLSGVMQLSVSGLAALACFFAGGVLVAGRVYRKGGYDE